MRLRLVPTRYRWYPIQYASPGNYCCLVVLVDKQFALCSTGKYVVIYRLSCLTYSASRGIMVLGSMGQRTIVFVNIKM